MRRADRILFDTAKDGVQKSKLDDHSKEGTSVALEMSGEARHGYRNESPRLGGRVSVLTDNERIYTMAWRKKGIKELKRRATRSQAS